MADSSIRKWAIPDGHNLIAVGALRNWYVSLAPRILVGELDADRPIAVENGK